MPTIQHILRERRSDAIEKVRIGLRLDPFFEEMSPAQLADRKIDGIAWVTSEVIAAIDRPLEIILPRLFPDEPPLIRISGGGDDVFLHSPHVLKGGGLCVLPNSAAIDASRPDEVVKLCVQNAIDILTGARSEDFRDEFAVYWSLGISGKAKKFLLVDPADSLGVLCFAEVLDSLVVVGASERSIARWVSSFVGKSEHAGLIRPCLVVDVREPLLPQEYPNNVWDVRDLVKRLNADVLNQLDHLICDSTRFFAVLFKQSIDASTTLAGVLAMGGGLKDVKRIPGFRKGMAPTQLLISHGKNQLKKKPIDRGIVQRVDHEWVHTRGGEGADLCDKKILLVGCGSLGGYVAHLLGRAGVGNLMLVDNDRFDWENVGRHVLGPSEVGKSKSRALSRRLQRDLPHLRIDFFSGDWRDWIEKGNSDQFDQFDLVVSTVGDWSCERPLNLLTRRDETPPMIFGWIEPYGIAGHALLVGGDGGCMECGVDAFGHFVRAVGVFESGTLTKEPGGCTYYQEYGPLSVVPVAETVARLAVQVLRTGTQRSELRTWIGPSEEILRRGGRLAASWRERVTGELLSQTLITEWPPENHCTVCS